MSPVALRWNPSGLLSLRHFVLRQKDNAFTPTPRSGSRLPLQKRPSILPVVPENLIVELTATAPYPRSIDQSFTPIC